MVTSTGDHVTIVGLGAHQFENEDRDFLTVLDTQGTRYLVRVDAEDNYMATVSGSNEIPRLAETLAMPYVSLPGSSNQNKNPELFLKLLEWTGFDISNVIATWWPLMQGEGIYLSEDTTLECTELNGYSSITLGVIVNDQITPWKLMNEDAGPNGETLYLGCDYQWSTNAGGGVANQISFLGNYPATDAQWRASLLMWAFVFYGVPRSVFVS